MRLLRPHLQLLDVVSEVAHAARRCEALQPLQLRQHPAQPGSDITQVRVQLLVLLEILLGLKVRPLGLQQLPALDHTWSLTPDQVKLTN